MRPREDGQLTGRTARRRVVRVTVPSDGFPGRAVARADLLATKEPLGIRVDGSALSVTMRTPGDEVELAAGSLVGEAVVRSRDDIAAISLNAVDQVVGCALLRGCVPLAGCALLV